MKAVIELYVEIIEGERRTKEVRVFGEDGIFIERIINDDRRKDVTHLNQYKGADVYVFFDGVLEGKGEFYNAGFNDEGITMLQYFDVRLN